MTEIYTIFVEIYISSLFIFLFFKSFFKIISFNNLFDGIKLCTYDNVIKKYFLNKNFYMRVRERV